MGLLNGSTTTKTETILTPHQKALQNMAMPYAKEYAKRNMQIPKKATLVQPMNALQKQGQNMALDAAKGAQTDIAKNAAGGSDFLLNKALFPETNPALAKTIDAATRPIQQNLMEETLPGLRSGAAVSGNYGSSRQGIAEGLASGRASQAIGDTGAKVANANYQAGLDAMTKALGLAPQTQAMQATPGLTVSGVGEVQQAQKQAERDANLARYFFNNQIPLTKATNLTALANGQPGSTTATSSSGSTGLLQGALGGAGLGSAIPGIGTIGGAGIGALLAALG